MITSLPRLALVVASVLSTHLIASASVQINLGGVHLGSGTAATLDDDAITLTFEDFATDVVRLTIGVKPTSTKVTQLLFNVDSLITGLSLTNIDLPNTSPDNTLSLVQNGQSMNSTLDGFDIELAFGSSGANGAFNYLNSPSIFLITKVSGTGNLTEDSFNVATAGGYYGAVHINLPTGPTSANSGKYGSTDIPVDPDGEPDGTVPEPTSLAVFSLLGIAAMIGYRKHIWC